MNLSYEKLVNYWKVCIFFTYITVTCAFIGTAPIRWAIGAFAAPQVSLRNAFTWQWNRTHFYIKWFKLLILLTCFWFYLHKFQTGWFFLEAHSDLWTDRGYFSVVTEQVNNAWTVVLQHLRALQANILRNMHQKIFLFHSSPCCSIVPVKSCILHLTAYQYHHWNLVYWQYR